MISLTNIPLSPSPPSPHRFINYTRDMDPLTTRRLIVKALKVWSDATPLSFREVKNDQADIVIQFSSKFHGDGYPFDGPGKSCQ